MGKGRPAASAIRGSSEGGRKALELGGDVGLVGSRH